ncbi:putative holin-like toxin [uncultured Phascolarctobacterium sp.]
MEVDTMTMFETLSLMIGFATLVVFIISLTHKR